MSEVVLYISLTMCCNLPRHHSKRDGREGIKHAWTFLNTNPIEKWQGDNVEFQLSFVGLETHH